MFDKNKVKKILNDLVSELTPRLEAINADVTHKNGPVSADFAEQVVDTENDEVLNNLQYATAQELQQVKDALQRLDDGSYGVCTACGGAIEEKRLEAIPFSAHCISCAAND